MGIIKRFASENYVAEQITTEINNTVVNFENTVSDLVSAHNVATDAHSDIRAEISNIFSEIAEKEQLQPEFANSIEECTDTSKMYVLPDGMIYAYMLTEKEVPSGAGYTNLLPQAKDTDRTTVYNGKGYKENTKLSGSGGGESTAGSGKEAMCSSGFIFPVAAGDKLRIKGIRPVSGSNHYVVGYDSANARTGNDTIMFVSVDGVLTFGTTGSSGKYTIEDDGTIVYTINTAKLGANVNAVRVCAAMDENTIITLNEEIKEGGTEIVKEYAWASTGHAFVPADYENRIIAVEKKAMNHTERIAALENCVAIGSDNTVEAAYTLMKNWKYPIHEDAPVFLLEENKPAIPSSDWTTEAIYAKYDALMASNSHYITKVNCGMASDGTTPIYVYHFNEPTPHYNGSVWSETKATILVCSGVHPTEQSGVWSMYYAMEEITNNKKLLDLRRNVHFIVMPMINPTGFTDSTYGVRNPDGIQVHYNFEVDFKYPSDSGYVTHGNRNHGGETPLSIPETQYFDALMNEYKDTLACVLSCHNNDVDTHWGTGFIWSSCATHFMCNLGFRLADKMSAAWREKHGAAFDEGVRWANEYALTKTAEGSSIFTASKEQPEWDYRVGMASLSGSGGTEYKQALKYGVHGINVEVCDRCMILDRDFNQKRTSNVTTMGCETYVNFFRTFMAAYDPKDKKDYAPNLPWSE